MDESNAELAEGKEAAASRRTTWRDKVQFGVSEGMYLFGLGLLFAGLWIWMGAGQALTVSGGILLGSATMNELVKELRPRSEA